MPPCTIDEQCVYYDMNHEQRGLAIIFNHFEFSPESGIKKRYGTKVDCNRLEKTFTELDFVVKIHDDLTRDEIFTELQKGNM